MGERGPLRLEVEVEEPPPKRTGGAGGGREGRRVKGGVGSLEVDRTGEEGLLWRDEGRRGRGEEGEVGAGREAAVSSEGP